MVRHLSAIQACSRNRCLSAVDTLFPDGAPLHHGNHYSGLAGGHRPPRRRHEVVTVIELTNVTKTFNADKHNRFTAVDDISLTINPGLLTILKGPSGSGKTTLLALIGCMARPSSGRIRLHGIRTSFFSDADGGSFLDITSLPERFLTEIRRTTFGFIFQQFNLVKGISALENIMLPAYPTGEGQAVFRQRALELMELFSVSRHAASPVDWLSG